MRFTIYAYLFSKIYSNVLQYTINFEPVEVEKTLLDSDLNDLNQLKKLPLISKSDALKWIVDDLKQIEAGWDIHTDDEINKSLVDQLEQAMLQERGSVIIFGNIQKYKTVRMVQTFLDDHGYFNLQTKVPHHFVLEDYFEESKKVIN